MRTLFVTISISVLCLYGCGGGNKSKSPVGTAGIPSTSGEQAGSTRGGHVQPDPSSKQGPVATSNNLPTESMVSIPGGGTVTVRGSFYNGANKPGDFTWMLQQKAYARTLFVFNDNEGQSDAFFAGDRRTIAADMTDTGCGKGKGNGAIRPFQCDTPPRAAGIPTGSYATGKGVGYETITPHVKGKIDRSINHIRALVNTGNYDVVLFSQANGYRIIGGKIFETSDQVKSYIFESLLQLAPIA